MNDGGNKTRYDELRSLGLMDLAEVLAMNQYNLTSRVFEAVGFRCGETTYNKIKDDWIKWLEESVPTVYSPEDIFKRGRGQNETP